MYFKFKCPECGQSLKVRQELAGQKRNCPYCKASVRIPNTDEIAFDLPPLDSPGFPDFSSESSSSGGGFDLSSLQVESPSTRLQTKSGTKKALQGSTQSHSATEGEFTDPSDVGLLWTGLIGFGAMIVFMLLMVPIRNTYLGGLFLNGGVQGVAIQCLTTFLFFWSVAILYQKHQKIKRQRNYLLMDVLPTDISQEIRVETLDRFVDNIRQLPGEHGESFLINRVLRGLQHFRVRRSAAETVTMMNSQSEIDSNNVASSYTPLKVLIWAIPTMGFIGTVLGISLAVAELSGALGGDDASQLLESLKGMFGGLGTAFNTTLVALVMSMIIKFPMSSLQKSEEGVLNWVDEYCNENLLRRLNDGREKVETQQTGPYDTTVFRRAVEEAMATQQAELEAWVKKLELVGQTITRQTADGWNEIHSKILASQHDITNQLLQQVQAKTVEMQAEHQQQQARLQDQLSQMQEIAAGLQNTLSTLAGQAAESQAQMTTTVEGTSQRMEQYFAGLERGVTSLSDVLGKLGSETVVVQQVAVPATTNGRGGWFGLGSKNGKARRNGRH